MSLRDKEPGSLGIALLLCSFLFAGCLKPKPATTNLPKKPPVTVQLESQPGEATVFSDPMNQHAAWHVKWGKVQLTVVGEKPTVGTMHDVSGELFENGKPQRFRADEAIADEASLVLTLTGRVSVFSAEDSTNLICDKVVYLAKPQLLRAIGNVTVKS